MHRDFFVFFPCGKLERFRFAVVGLFVHGLEFALVGEGDEAFEGRNMNVIGVF